MEVTFIFIFMFLVGIPALVTGLLMVFRFLGSLGQAGLIPAPPPESCPPGVGDWTTLTKAEVDSGRLPPRCMKCGRDADSGLPLTFTHVPPWTGGLLLFGILPGIIAASAYRKVMRVSCPVCACCQDEARRTRRRGRFTLVGAGLVLLVAVLVALLGLGILSSPNGEREPVGGSFLLTAILIALPAFIFLVIGLVDVQKGTPEAWFRAREITDRDITLMNVAPQFTHAVLQTRGSGARNAAV